MTSSTSPPRIDILLTAVPCPDLSPYFPSFPPFTGPTIIDQLFAPRPAGDYHITVRLQNGGSETMISEGRLVIHEEVPDVEVRPWVAPVAGGAQLHVRAHGVLCLQGSGCPETGIVTIDGQPFTARYTPDELIVDAAPPHAEGAVDVGIRYNGKELRSNALLYYYDPRNEPEWSVFDPVLLPVLDGGPGAFGSKWETEAIVSAEPTYYVAAVAPPNAADTLGRRFSGRGFPNGAVFAVPRRESGQTHFALRLRETSRNPDGYGTELPVVREKDFLSFGMSLYDVPAGPRFRSKLRIYGLNPPEGDEGDVSVHILLSGTNRELGSQPLPWTRPRCTFDSCMPAYAELDLDRLSSIPEIRAGGRFDLELWTNYAKVWGFVSVVDNTTQSVSVISPR
ncbi:MAG TPA: hypothetical protein VF713_25280 [Thermoanaerobaculia bacterium]